jgi:sigma-B regulation protein RsbU (phosphoserine phosphatase)
MAIAIQAADQQVVSILRDQLSQICIATAFLITGLTACAIAVLRRRNGVRVFLWLGIWSAGYGVQHLLGAPAVVAALPHWLRIAAPLMQTSTSYLLVVFGSLAWLDLTVGRLRKIVVAITILAALTAVVGIGWFLVTGVANKFMLLNNLLATCVLAILISAVTSKRLFHKYLLLPERGFLVFGTFVFASEALYANVAHPLGYSLPILFDHLCFAILLIAFGYSALRLVLSNEHRLHAIDNELEIARQIQSSILPATVPKVDNLCIAAIYRPMTSVAGDFYEFLPVDRMHAGFLVADVCGHGVPAALISSILRSPFNP